MSPVLWGNEPDLPETFCYMHQLKQFDSKVPMLDHSSTENNSPKFLASIHIKVFFVCGKIIHKYFHTL